MAEQRNLFQELDEIKTTLENEKKIPKNLHEQLKTKDPQVISFLEETELYWVYTGGKKVKKQKDKERKQKLIKISIFAIIQIILSIVSAIIVSPYVLIFLGVFLAVAVPYLYICIADYKTSKLDVKLKYDERPETPFIKYDKDENGVVFPVKRSTPNILKICLVVVQLLIYFAFEFVGILLCIQDFNVALIIVSVAELVVGLVLFCLLIVGYRTDFCWRLWFIDNNNEFPYDTFAEFITENDTKLNIKK